MGATKKTALPRKAVKTLVVKPVATMTSTPASRVKVVATNKPAKRKKNK